MSEEVFSRLVDEGPVDSSKILREDEILTDDDKKKPEHQKQDTNKPKKPCANCTCGLADKQEEVSSVPKSSCNSCHLGDAFRCASCPYKGMPAFKPGEKITIDTTLSDL